MVFNGLSRAKMWHPEGPPQSFWKPKNMWGVGIFHAVS